MPIADTLKSAGNLIKAIGVFLALLPGVAVLVGLVQLPGSMEALVKFLSGALGVTIVLAVLLSSAPIRRMKGIVAAALILGCALGGAVASTSYMIYAGHHLLPPPDGNGGAIAIPDEPSTELARLMQPFGDDDYAEALMVSVQRDRIRRLMDRDSSASISKMVGLLLTGQLLLVFAIALGAWKLAERDAAATRRAGRNRPPSAEPGT